MKLELYKKIANKFPGNEKLGIIFLREIKQVESVINKLDCTIQENVSIKDGKIIRRALATAFAELHSEIEMPILAKFPNLKEEK